MTKLRLYLIPLIILSLHRQVTQAQQPQALQSGAYYEWRQPGLDTVEDVDFNEVSTGLVSSAVSATDNGELPGHPGSTYEFDLSSSAQATATTISTAMSITTSATYVGEELDRSTIDGGRGRVSSDAGVLLGTYTVSGPWAPGTAVWQPVALNLGASTNTTLQERERPDDCQFCENVIWATLNGGARVAGERGGFL